MSHYRIIISTSFVAIAVVGCGRLVVTDKQEDVTDKQEEVVVKKPDQSSVAKGSGENATQEKDAVVLIKAKNEPDLMFQKMGNEGTPDVTFFGDVLTIGVLSPRLEVKNIAKSIVIEYKVRWAERQPDKRYSIDLDDLKKSIGALKEVPSMIDGLSLGEEIRLGIGDLSIRFGNSMKDTESISYGSNGYYINVDSFQHNDGESAQSLKIFASGFADFLGQLVAKAENVKVEVNVPSKPAASK